MEERTVSFPCGELSLEGMVSIPEGGSPFPAVIVCHPHPLYGGSMENNVVDSLCAALTEAGFISFKFNFRGVGGSEGRYSDGIGEQEDARAAISLVSGLAEVDAERVGLAGYSAGAGFSLPVGVEDTRIKALVAVSPPISMYDFASLKSSPKSKLLISGKRDLIVPGEQFLDFCQGLAEPRECDTVEGADHCWWGYEPALADRVVAFFIKTLK